MIETLFTASVTALFICSVLASDGGVSAWSSTRQLGEYEGPQDGITREPKQGD